MLFYKDLENKVHVLADAANVHWLPAGCTSITEAEATALANPVPSANEVIIKQIIDLEATVTQRRIRESVLGIDNGWLADTNAAIAALRAGLQQ